MGTTRRALALVVAVAAVSALLLAVPAAPASGQACLPSGGQGIADPELADGEFVFVGGGWGHGAGMSQYGAQGAARLGCSATQILSTYFQGVSFQEEPAPVPIVVGLADAAETADVRADAGPIPWELCHYVTGDCEPLEVTQPQGTVWTVAVQPDATYRITSGEELVFEGGDYELLLRAVLSQTDDETRIAHLASTNNSYRWGVLQFDSVRADPATMFVTLELPDVERYMRGIAEVPSAWPEQALRAQAIAARSYARQRIAALGLRTACRCHVYTSTRDQAYTGWDHEAADIAGGRRWLAAVDATARTVMTFGDQPAEAFYSSSHGGISESSRFVFGEALAYVQPVDDSRWDLASDNPLRRWSAGVSGEQIGAMAGVGDVSEVRILEPLGAGGRVGDPALGYGGVEVVGTQGRRILSGNEFRSALGLRSTLFFLRQVNPDARTPSPPDAPAGPRRIDRVAADNRIDTAVAVSATHWVESDAVVLATGDDFPDALAGGALAASLDAPLLLSSAAQLPQTVAAEIQRLGAGTAWLLGGERALAPAVAEALAAMGLQVRRLAGATRFETAAATAAAAAGDRTATTASLALGASWPDAVAAGALAATPARPPTLLTAQDGVPLPTMQALAELGVEQVTLIGGTAVIAGTVAEQLSAAGYDVTRLSGSDRFATSAAVADAALRALGDGVPIVLASGAAFPDALTAGALAARLGGPLLLVPAGDLDAGPAARAFVSEHSSALTSGLIVGGPAAVSDNVAVQLGAALGG